MKMKTYSITRWEKCRSILPRPLVGGSWAWPLQALDRRIVQLPEPSPWSGSTFVYEYRLRAA